MDPIIEEMQANIGRPIRHEAFCRWVEHLVTQVQPKLDLVDTIEAATKPEQVKVKK